MSTHKKCPYCAEEIQDEAIKCKHCGELLQKNSQIIIPLKQDSIQNPKKPKGCLFWVRIWVGIIVALGIIGNIVTASSGHVSSAEQIKQENIILPQYSVLGTSIRGSLPQYTHFEMSILVSGNITKAGLKVLLNKLYTEATSKRASEGLPSYYRIGIYAYTSADSAPGQWIAGLYKSYDSDSPEFKIRKIKMESIGAQPEDRFGLTEEKRKEVYKEFVQISLRVDSEAEKQYPLAQRKESFDQWWKKTDEIAVSLQNKYNEELAMKYGLTCEQLKEIYGEGLEKDWPILKK